MNARVADAENTDRLFCWQQVLRVRPLLRLSLPYAPGEQSDRLLALYALFSALEEAICRVSDEGVARVKLGWWQQQLFGPENHVSTHPITRQLRLCGLITIPSQNHFRGLLNTTMARLDAPAPANEHELKTYCQMIGLYPMRLELEMPNERDMENKPLAAACAVNGLVQLLRESSRSQMQAYAWVPLNMLARHGLTRDELQSGAEPDRSRQLLKQLCMLGLSWTSDEIGRIGVCDSGGKFGMNWRQHHRHWIIQTQLNVRKLKKLPELNTLRLRRAFSITGVGDVWQAWRSARKISAGGNPI